VTPSNYLESNIFILGFKPLMRVLYFQILVSVGRVCFVDFKVFSLENTLHTAKLFVSG